ncbi:hypothetical protein B0H19DRAFT_1270657 [Mycena capillaripes]|nr:hypothetical protein B0H19DRAFT_1270657 [Mycena capillaripes]
MPRAHRDARLPPQPKLPWVYVGNLNPHIEDEQLWTHFRVAGRVRSVDIRYTGGEAGNPEMGFRYAVVRFWSPKFAHTALYLDRTCIRGFPGNHLAVRAAIIDLPETENLYRVLVDEEAPAELQPTGLVTASGARLSVAPVGQTVVWKPSAAQLETRSTAQGKRIVVGGVTFSKTRK